jgi:uncharacterized protein (TIGR03437 family)
MPLQDSPNETSGFCETRIPGAVTVSATWVVSVFGTSLASVTLAATGVPVPTQMGNVRVLVHQIPVPVLYVLPTQVNFQLPYGLPPGVAAIQEYRPAKVGHLEGLIQPATFLMRQSPVAELSAMP